MPRSAKSGANARSTANVQSSEALELIKTLVSGGTDTSRLLELYYWTREPGIVELIRAYLDLPERSQRSLSTFLLNGRPKMIVCSFDQQGRLVLSRATADEAIGGTGKAGGGNPAAVRTDKERIASDT